MNGIDKLKAWQPSATDIKDAGNCHCKHRGKLLFYFIDQERRETAMGDGVYVEGGFFCVLCGFSNAGCMHIDDYDNAPNAEGE